MHELFLPKPHLILEIRDEFFVVVAAAFWTGQKHESHTHTRADRVWSGQAPTRNTSLIRDIKRTDQTVPVKNTHNHGGCNQFCIRQIVRRSIGASQGSISMKKHENGHNPGKTPRGAPMLDIIGAANGQEG